MTRVFAAVLAVLCAVMLMAGSMGLAKAAADRRSGSADIQRLKDRLSEYIDTDSALSGKKSYEQEKKTLDRKEQIQQENVSEHRRALAEYTATKGGLTQGTEALDKADAAMAMGKEQYELGLKEFEAQEAAFYEGYEQYLQGVQQLEQARMAYDVASAALDAAEAQLAQMPVMGDIESKSDLVEQGISQLDAAINAYDQAESYVNDLAARGFISPEQLKQLNDAVTDAAGMSPEEMRARAKETRDDLANNGEDAIDDEDFERIKGAYDASRDRINAASAAMREQIAQAKTMLAEQGEQLAAAQAEMDALAPIMEEGKKGIEFGRAQLEAAGAQIAMGENALYEGRTAIWYQLGQLRDKLAELEQSKQELDENRENLEKSRAAAEEKKTLEQRRNSLRLMLLERDGIEQRVDEGMELVDAANEYISELETKTAGDYQGRAAAYIVMIAGAVAGFVGIPAAFEKTNKRAMLVLPPFVCLGCAVAAELICLSLGRGSSYSAIGVMIFAVIQLILVLPKKKAA